MINLTKNGFNTSYDLDGMLHDDAVWLSMQIKEDKDLFINLAQKFDLRQKDWDTFWKRVRAVRSVIDNDKKEIETRLHDKKRMMTKDEFEFAEFYLGEADEVSNCCSATIIGTDICSECKEHCGKVYVFQT